MKRRSFLKDSLRKSAGQLVLAGLVPAGAKSAGSIAKKKTILKMGILTDLHHDLIPDGLQRLRAFIDEMNQVKPDLIMQMGDFCFPKETNRALMDLWNGFPGPKYHVLGNHDTDGGFTKEQALTFWNAKARYHSFDLNGYHFVILDGNERNTEDSYKGYARSIGAEQFAWLANDLEATRLPVLVFCHQGIDNDINGIQEGTRIRVLFEQANARARFNKVKAVFSGHHHLDYVNIINGIHYVQINSMSYNWVGEKFAKNRYDDETHKKYQHLKYMVPYKDPLWAVVTIYSDGSLEVEGRKTEFIGPSPEQMGMTALEKAYPIVPHISDRKFDRL